MTKEIRGQVKGRGKHISIVVAQFNEYITQRLLDGCLDELKKQGVSSKQISVVWVPGTFEIPLVAQKLAKKKTVDAVICLGCIIEGETLHFNLVAEAATEGIMQVSLQTHKPVIFEILATKTVALANARSKVKGVNKGRDAALAAIEMVDVLQKIK